MLKRCHLTVLDLAISLDRLSLSMGEQSLKKMGFSWASWTSRMAKSIVVRFVVRKGNLMKNMEERLIASGHPVSWWTVHRYLTNVAEVKAIQNHVFSQNNGSPETPDAEVCSVEAQLDRSKLEALLVHKQVSFQPLSPTHKTKQSLLDSFVTQRRLPEKVQAATNNSDVCG